MSDGFRTDARQALRRLRRSPGFTIVGVATLALGVSAATAAFSAVDRALLRPPAFPEAGRIVQAWETHAGKGWRRFGVSAPAFREWRDARAVFRHTAAYVDASANLLAGDRPRRVRLTLATSELFDVLGHPPALGRLLRPDDPVHVTVLGHRLWRSEFGADPAVVGRSIRLDDAPHTVVGVAPELDAPFSEVDLFRPLQADDDRRGARWLAVIARLAPGVGVDEAQAYLASWARVSERDRPETCAGWTAETTTLHAATTESRRPLLLLLMAAAGLVLLIASANAAGLLVLRGLEREHEAAVRAALGASRARMLRPLLLEGLGLTAAGTLAGLLAAPAALRALQAVAGPSLGGRDGLDARSLAVAGASAALVAATFALTACARAVRGDQRLAQAGTRTLTARRGAQRALATGQMALALVLLVACGLVGRSLVRLLRVDPGFDPRGALAFRVAPPQAPPRPEQSEAEFLRQYLQGRHRAAVFYRELRDRLAAQGGVLAVGAVNRLPLTGNWWSIGVEADGAAAAPADALDASGRVVTPGYFAAAGIVRREGRDFTDGDDARAPLVAIVSESLARQLWPRGAALGGRLRVDGGERGPVTIVGVVADVRLSRLDAAPRATVYVPVAQALFGFYPDWGMDVVVRAAVDPEAVLSHARAQVRALDPTLPVFAAARLDEVLDSNLADRRSVLALLAALAAAAVGLSGLGLYGVLAHAVRQRRREVALRMALGAWPGAIVALVVGHGIRAAAVAVALGVPAALAGGRLLRGVLYQIGPSDPASLLGAAALVLATALLASALPAWRAARIQPQRALSED